MMGFTIMVDIAIERKNWDAVRGAYCHVLLDGPEDSIRGLAIRMLSLIETQGLSALNEIPTPDCCLGDVERWDNAWRKLKQGG